MIILTPPQINAVVEDLVGTCHDFNDTLEELTGYSEDDIDPGSLEEIDTFIFRCDQCEWWCELSEMSDVEGICDDCGCGAAEDE